MLKGLINNTKNALARKFSSHTKISKMSDETISIILDTIEEEMAFQNEDEGIPMLQKSKCRRCCCSATSL